MSEPPHFDPLPERIDSETSLDALLSQPTPEVVEAVAQLESPLVVVGAGGKMGPTLCWMARRAAEMAGSDLRVVAASRFSDDAKAAWLKARGIDTVSVDVLDRASLDRLPDSPNVLMLVGLKFGTHSNPGLTWATNTLGPAAVCERYAGSRIVALSTGNVYPNAPVSGPGPAEDAPLTPVGEYANAAVARERTLDYFSIRDATPIAKLRLNYAVEMRYGVLLDIADKVWSQAPIDLANGTVNVIWQGDANAFILRSFGLASVPASAWNLSSPIAYSVRALATAFGQRLGREPRFVGTEAEDALLTNASALTGRFGAPATSVERVIDWIVDWTRNGGVRWGKSTGFETRDGRF